jgi:hypothetical protein
MRIAVEELTESLQQWFSSKNAIAVDFRHAATGEASSGEDYRIIHEYSFSPKSERKALIEVWLTDVGSVAVGVERWSRIALRSSLRSHSKRFVAGFEPKSLDIKTVLQMCDLISTGEIEVGAYGLLGRLIACEIKSCNAEKLRMFPRVSAPISGLADIGILKRVRLSYKNWESMAENE